MLPDRHDCGHAGDLLILAIRPGGATSDAAAVSHRERTCPWALKWMLRDTYDHGRLAEGAVAEGVDQQRYSLHLYWF
jgi:hypothetical protein